MTRCIQCGGSADLRIAWLAKKSEDENGPQECTICNECISLLWSRSRNTQFGQTVQIEPA